jgi:hypothetical protein
MLQVTDCMLAYNILSLHVGQPGKQFGEWQPISVFLAHVIPFFLNSLFRPTCISGNLPCDFKRTLIPMPINAMTRKRALNIISFINTTACSF